jgi:hypothetical protein
MQWDNSFYFLGIPITLMTIGGWLLFGTIGVGIALVLLGLVSIPLVGELVDKAVRRCGNVCICIVSSWTFWYNVFRI